VCGLPNDNGKIVGGLETEVILQIFLKNLGFNNFKTNLVPELFLKLVKTSNAIKGRTFFTDFQIYLPHI